MRCFILALLAVGSFSVAGSGPAAAGYVYPYCLQSQIDASDCTYSTYEQCQASASGRGADCIVNPIVAFASQNQQPQPQRRAPRRSYNY